jgi:hypothetical protein
MKNYMTSTCSLAKRLVKVDRKEGQSVCFEALFFVSGAFGRVVGAHKKNTREPRAVKIIEKRHCSEQEMRRINEEVGHLFRFNHVSLSPRH